MIQHRLRNYIEKPFTPLIVISGALSACQPERLQQPGPGQEQPNIIFVLTDDLGYGDVGVLFQNRRRFIKRCQGQRLVIYIYR